MTPNVPNTGLVTTDAAGNLAEWLGASAVTSRVDRYLAQLCKARGLPPVPKTTAGGEGNAPSRRASSMPSIAGMRMSASTTSAASVSSRRRASTPIPCVGWCGWCC